MGTTNTRKLDEWRHRPFYTTIRGHTVVITGHAFDMAARRFRRPPHQVVANVAMLLEREISGPLDDGALLYLLSPWPEGVPRAGNHHVFVVAYNEKFDSYNVVTVVDERSHPTRYENQKEIPDGYHL